LPDSGAIRPDGVGVGGLEQVSPRVRARGDNNPFAPPRMLDQAGLLEALERRYSRIARAAIHPDDLG
jgi:hypothetical protein